jgi:hypothetical protein
MTRKRLFVVPIYLLVGICLSACIFYVAPLFIAMFISENIADSMLPPPYPNSRLVSTYRSGGPDAIWEWITYESTDKVDEVVKYMETYFPEFNLGKLTSSKGPVYHSGKADTSLLSTWVSFAVSGSQYNIPSASVQIYQSPDKPQVTVILFRLDWPGL